MTDDSERELHIEQPEEIEPTAVDDAPVALETDIEVGEPEASTDESDEATPEADDADASSVRKPAAQHVAMSHA